MVLSSRHAQYRCTHLTPRPEMPGSGARSRKRAHASTSGAATAGSCRVRLGHRMTSRRCPCDPPSPAQRTTGRHLSRRPHRPRGRRHAARRRVGARLVRRRAFAVVAPGGGDRGARLRAGADAAGAGEATGSRPIRAQGRKAVFGGSPRSGGPHRRAVSRSRWCRRWSRAATPHLQAGGCEAAAGLDRHGSIPIPPFVRPRSFTTDLRHRSSSLLCGAVVSTALYIPIRDN